MTEQWKPIPGYEGYYEVSDHGRIRSVAVGRNRKTGQILRPGTDRKGYRYLGLSRDGVRKDHKVHRLVLTAFRGTSELLALHGDGNPGNNHLSNLRWGTHMDNASDMILHGNSRNENTGKESCVRGHELSGDNLYLYFRNGKGGRHCKRCGVLRQKARRLGIPVEQLITEMEVPE